MSIKWLEEIGEMIMSSAGLAGRTVAPVGHDLRFRSGQIAINGLSLSLFIARIPASPDQRLYR